ncbi:MAG: hypothetical protein ACSLEM_00420 [Candidatus Malihini olakiniferum]
MLIARFNHLKAKVIYLFNWDALSSYLILLISMPLAMINNFLFKYSETKASGLSFFLSDSLLPWIALSLFGSVVAIFMFIFENAFR